MPEKYSRQVDTFQVESFLWESGFLSSFSKSQIKDERISLPWRTFCNEIDVSLLLIILDLLWLEIPFGSIYNWAVNVYIYIKRLAQLGFENYLFVGLLDLVIDIYIYIYISFLLMLFLFSVIYSPWYHNPAANLWIKDCEHTDLRINLWRNIVLFYYHHWSPIQYYILHYHN